MRYLPMILVAGLFLSVGLLAGSGPAHAAMPTLALDRSAVAAPQLKRLPTDATADTIAVPIAVAITAMDMATATDAHITAMATAGPIMVMDMGVAGVTERGRSPILIRGFNRSRWRPRPGRFPPPDQPAG